MTRVLRRSFPLVLLIAACGASACGFGSPPCASGAPPPLRIAVANPQASLPGNRVMQAAMFTEMALVRLDHRGLPMAGLARTWHTTDRQTWTFTLQHDLRAHNGQLLSAADVASAIRQRVDVVSYYPVWKDVVRIDTPSADTIVVHLRRPSSVFLEALSMLGLVDIDEDRVRGSGPFRLIRDTPAEMDYASFADFWAGPPRPPGLRVRFYPSARAAWAAFLRDEADFLYEVPPATASLLASHPDVRLYRGPPRFIHLLGFQQRHLLLRDVRVRRALNLAIDRNAIAQRVFAGYTHASAGPFAPDYWAADGLGTPWPYDPAQARRLLDAATGERDGPIELTCLTSSEFPLSADVAADLESQLRRVNVRLRLVALTRGPMIDRLARGDFDTFVVQMATGASGMWVRTHWHSGGAGPVANIGYASADAALDALASAASPEAERDAVRAVLDIMREDPPAAFLVPAPILRAVRRSWRVPEDPADIRASIPRWTFTEAGCRGL